MLHMLYLYICIYVQIWRDNFDFRLMISMFSCMFGVDYVLNPRMCAGRVLDLNEWLGRAWNIYKRILFMLYE